MSGGGGANVVVVSSILFNTCKGGGVLVVAMLLHSTNLGASVMSIEGGEGGPAGSVTSTSTDGILKSSLSTLLVSLSEGAGEGGWVEVVRNNLRGEFSGRTRLPPPWNSSFGSIGGKGGVGGSVGWFSWVGKSSRVAVVVRSSCSGFQAGAARARL